MYKLTITKIHDRVRTIFHLRQFFPTWSVDLIAQTISHLPMIVSNMDLDPLTVNSFLTGCSDFTYVIILNNDDADKPSEYEIAQEWFDQLTISDQEKINTLINHWVLQSINFK